MHDDRDDTHRSETDEMIERLLADDEALRSVQEGLEQARRGAGIPLDGLTSEAEATPPEPWKRDDA